MIRKLLIVPIAVFALAMAPVGFEAYAGCGGCEAKESSKKECKDSSKECKEKCASKCCSKKAKKCCNS